MNDNTRDMSKLGYREIGQLAELLTIYADAKWKGENNLTDGISWEYNPNSDNLFLVDEDFNCAMLNEKGELEMFLTCGNCGSEGFTSEDDNLKPILDGNDCLKCQSPL